MIIILGHTIERRKSGPWQPLVSSSSDHNAGDQGTTTTSFGKIDELDTGNSSPCGDGECTLLIFFHIGRI